MKRNAAVVIAVVTLVVGVAWFKHGQRSANSGSDAGGLPRLVELGGGQCDDCRKMAPIIEELRSDYAGRLIVESIDVMKEADRAKAYDWHLIPTQILIDREGKELWRHQGFVAKEEIIKKLARASSLESFAQTPDGANDPAFAPASAPATAPADGPVPEPTRGPRLTLVTFDRACPCTLRKCEEWARVVGEVVPSFEGVQLERIDMEQASERYKQLCQRHGAEGAPLVFVFGRDGKLVTKFDEDLDQARLDAALGKATAD